MDFNKYSVSYPNNDLTQGKLIADPEHRFTVSGAASDVYWSIGLIPMKAWLQEARRSRDLRTGSVFTHWIMARLLKAIIDTGGEVVIPAIDESKLSNLASQSFEQALETPYSIPNRASGWITSFEKAKELFKEFDEKIQRYWQELISEVKQQKYWKTYIWNIIKGLPDYPCPLDVVWALKKVKFEKAAAEAKKMQQGLDQINGLYAAVKRTRPIGENIHSAPVPKCGQCGRREAIGGTDFKRWREFYQNSWEMDSDIIKGYRFEKSERLCPVCITKRLAAYLSNTAFPSTNEIAAQKWINEIKSASDELKRKWQNLLRIAQQVPGFKKDTDDPYILIHPRTLKRLLKDADEQTSVEMNKVKEAFDDLKDAIKQYNKGENNLKLRTKPSNYLAVLTFDGDNMGKRFKEAQNPNTLSRELYDFSEKCRSIIEDNLGVDFYLGGDEGLVLCPSENVLELAGKIRECWNKIIDKTTLSIGVCIFDREKPLGEALKFAEEALESHAKGLEGKNALSIGVQTASGNQWTITFPWGEDWERILAAQELLLNKKLSMNWCYDLEHFFADIPKEAWENRSSRFAMREEFKRLTQRSTLVSHNKGNGKLKDENCQAIGLNKWAEKKPIVPVQNHASQFHLLAFLVREAW